MNEEWRVVKGWENYMVSDQGNIMGKRKGGSYVMSRRITRGGYHAACFTKSGKHHYFRMNRLVCEAFNGSPNEGDHASHLNGDRADNRACNLKWESRKDNEARKHEHGTILQGERVHCSKLTADEVRAIRVLRESGCKLLEIGKQFGICEATVCLIAKRRTWKHVI
jgi:hypothetical protein